MDYIDYIDYINYTNYINSINYKDYSNGTGYKNYSKYTNYWSYPSDSDYQLCSCVKPLKLPKLFCIISQRCCPKLHYYINYQGSIFWKSSNSPRNDFGTRLHYYILHKITDFFLRKLLKKLHYYKLYKKNDFFFGKIGVKMTKNYIITYITRGLIFWSDQKWHVSSHI